MAGFVDPTDYEMWSYEPEVVVSLRNWDLHATDISFTNVEGL
jgi:hypothetical protein